MAGVGIERTVNHVRYLPDMGWQPVVVAPRNPGYRLVDPSSLASLPPTLDLHRAPSVEPAHVRAVARRLSEWLPRDVTNSGTAGRGIPIPDGASGRRPAGTSARVRQWLNEVWANAIPLLFFPDDEILWAISAAAVGWHVHRQQPVDAIYSSAPPASSHLAAALVHSFTGVPWVADFRDPWVGNTFAKELPAPYEWMRIELERHVVTAAARTVFATPGLHAAYADRYPGLARRFVTITNGYDRTELDRVPRPRRRTSRPFRLIYAGSVYGDRELVIFLDGVARLLTRRPQLADDLQVEFVGSLSEPNRRLLDERRPAFGAVVSHSPHVPRSVALEEIADADAGLLLLADGPGRSMFIGGKLFDYIGLDRPVLAVAPPGDARKVLSDLEWGVVADPTPEGVANGLEEILGYRTPRAHADDSDRFARRQLAADLAAVLREAAGFGTA